MDIVVRGNGLHTSETRALEKMQQQLRSSWYGYASVLLADKQGSMEFDLIMITHDRILAVELKEWNGKLENYDGKWYITQGKKQPENRGKSAYHQKRDQAIRLSKILQTELTHKLGYYPFVETHVVLCGSATPEHLTDTEKRYVHTLDTFLNIREEYDSFVQTVRLPAFDNVNRQRPNTPLSREIFDKFFRGNRVQPADFKYMGYVAASAPEKVHGQNLYKEYSAKHVSQPASRALMRRWDLGALGLAFHDQDTWRKVAMREDYLFRIANSSNSPLEEFLLRPLVPLVEEAITSDCIELFELRKNTVRLQQYLALHGKKLTKDERIDITKALLAPYVELHSMGFAHRDIDTVNLWYSQDYRIIQLSSFQAAFIPEKGTVRDLSERLRCSDVLLPEDVYSTEGEVQNPFAKDVYLLALVAHRICFPDISITVEDGVSVWRTVIEDPFNGRLNAFFAKAMDLEQENRFSNAAEMLADFNTLAADKPLKYDDSAEVIEAITQGDFIKSQIMPFTMMAEFPPSQIEPPLLSENKVAYQCEYNGQNAFFKFWPKAVVDPKNPGVNRRILRMRKRIEKVEKDELPLPAVLEYGMFANGNGFYVLTFYEEGDVWTDYSSSLQTQEEKLRAALDLCNLLIGVHSKEFAHGDLHPGNVLVKTATESDNDGYRRQLLLIDALDYGDTSDPYNIDYGPKNPSCTDSVGRDSFAVYKMVKELLGDEAPKVIKEELALAKEQPDEIPVAIDPLAASIAISLEAISKPSQNPEKPLLFMTDKFQWPIDETRLQEDGREYLLFAERARKNEKLIHIRIISQDKRLTFHLDPESNLLSSYWLAEISLSDYVSAGRRASESFTRPISLKRGTPNQKDENTIVDFLLGLESVKSLVGFEEEVTDVGKLDLKEHPLRPTEIWQTLLSTEGDLLTRVEILNHDMEESQSGALLIPCVLQDGKDIEDFVASTMDEEIGVYLDGDNRSFGEVVPEECGGSLLSVRVNPSSYRSVKPKLKFGVELILESKLNSISRARRSRAMQRVLSGHSLINQLPAYFDSNSHTRSKVITAIPDEEEIRRLYDNEVEQLNSDQVIAFQRMVSEGPVTTLQGPPGTGKTSFVSKFIHYLFDKGLAQNILLVGQSHVSVDTVALKVREVCDNKSTDISVVRLGKESSIDDMMLGCHPSSIQRQIRYKFQREYEKRINALSARLMLTDALVEELAKLHRSINPILERIRTYQTQREQVAAKYKSSEDHLHEKLKEYDDRIASCINALESNIDTRGYSFKLGSPGNPDFWNELSTQIARQHGITNLLALQRLNNLIQISQDWIDVLGSGTANYDKFLTKTSQLVCGTLVGIGAGGINIEDMKFDFVIVDEAGRAQASELMIALQSGRRALLVGDHKQLPPVYEKRHIRAVARKLQIDERDARMTDFERAFIANSGQALSTQYRMIQPIGEIVSNCFYDGKLESYYQVAPDWCQKLPYPLSKPVAWIDSGEGSLSKLEDNDGKGNTSNKHEVAICLHMLKQLSRSEYAAKLVSLKSDKNPYPIGIITMYRVQKKLIEEELSRAEWALSLRDIIKVDTVDSYQGQESDILLLSLVRNNDQGLQGFLIDESRINVALSRAKHRLVIIGSKRMWSSINAPFALGKVVKFISEQYVKDPINYEIVTGTEVIQGKQHE